MTSACSPLQLIVGFCETKAHKKLTPYRQRLTLSKQISSANLEGLDQGDTTQCSWIIRVSCNVFTVVS